MKKVIMAAAIAVGLTGSSVAAVWSYRNSHVFQPSENSRELQENKVVFAANDDVQGHEQGNNDDGEEDDLWQKDKNADEKDQHSGKARYMLASAVSSGGTGAIGDNSGSKDSDTSENKNINNANRSEDYGSVNDSSNSNGQKDVIYDVTDDKSKADVILDNNKPSSDNSNGTGKNPDNTVPGNSGSSGENGSGSSDNQPSQPSKPGQPSIPSEPSGPSKPTKPSRPSKPSVDPDTDKTNPSNNGWIINKPYKEDIVPAKNESIVICKGNSWGAPALYMGQSVDAKTIYYCLDTYVCGEDGVQYLWGKDDWEKYIRIDAISFDNGESWVSDFPVTIPADIPDDQMMIRASYRLKQTDDWSETQVPYIVERTRLFILDTPIMNDGEKINTDNVLNDDQYPEVGSMINLMRYQWNYLGNSQLTELFPGWMENGELVPWFYNVEEGRHVLEPADMVPLSDEYVVSLQLQWMSDDYEVGWQYDNLCYLQTLTNIKQPEESEGADATTDEEKTLSVPEFIQAVDFEQDANVSVDYMEIPDTVLYIAPFGKTIDVREGFIVDEDNPIYTSTEDDLLMNKDQTEIMAVPSRLEQIHIPASVKKVNMSANNHVSELILDAQDMASLPEIAYDNLNHCKIIVKDALLEDFIIANHELLEKGTDNCVAIESEPDITYTVKNGAIVSSTGILCKVIESGTSSLKVANGINTIRKDALAQAQNVTTLLMPESGDIVTFEEGCLKESQVRTIFCYTEKQYENVLQQMEQAGAAADLKVELVNVSKEGYYYAMASENDEETVTLISVPENLTEFDGGVTSKEGKRIDIDEIGDGAFANCTSLQWVTLPESVKKIGYQAFAGCTALEGVLIDAKDTITIGNLAWDKCDALRFVASNAKEGIMMDDYDPVIKGDASSASYFNARFFYVPTNAEGYCSNCVGFVEESGVAGYAIEAIGETGKMLYGLNQEGAPWLALRSGLEVDERVQLPSTTIEVYSFAMSDTYAASGSYTVNWEDLSGQKYLDDGAFRKSTISGDIYFGDDYYIGAETFFSCPEITSITLPGDRVQIGMAAFEDCTSLTKAEIGNINSKSSLYAGLFSGCTNLTDITLHNQTPPQIILSGSMPFRFNMGWTPDEEAEKLHLHVPEGTEEQYVLDWRYLFGGYTGTQAQTVYLEMWQTIQLGLIDWFTWEYPTDEEVDAAAEKELLTLENRIRKMVGVDTVTEPTNYYPYRLSSAGELTLLGVPSNTEFSVLDSWVTGIPDGWFFDYIGTGAYSRCRQLQLVLIPSSLVGIYTNAFEGVDGSQLTLYFESDTPQQLLGGTREHPFTFGTVGDPTVMIPEGSEADYIKAWAYPMAGYEDEADLLLSLDWNLTEQERNDAIAEILMPVENHLRAMFGMEQITDAKDMLSYTIKESDDEKETETTEKETESESETKETEILPPTETETESESEMPPESETETETQQPIESETKESESQAEETGKEGEKDTPAQIPEKGQEGDTADQ